LIFTGLISRGSQETNEIMIERSMTVLILKYTVN
jgi:hypothetical protein